METDYSVTIPAALVSDFTFKILTDHVNVSVEIDRWNRKNPSAPIYLFDDEEFVLLGKLITSSTDSIIVLECKKYSVFLTLETFYDSPVMTKRLYWGIPEEFLDSMSEFDNRFVYEYEDGTFCKMFTYKGTKLYVSDIDSRGKYIWVS